MSYTSKIKDEISLKDTDYTKTEMIAELSGFIRNNGVIKDNSILLTSENKNIIKRLTNFIQVLYKTNPEINKVENLNFSKQDLYQIKISNKDILKDIGYYDEKDNYLKNPPSYILDDTGSIKAYLKGAFFCTGSINDPKTSRYHMELVIKMPDEAVFIQKLLNTFDLNAKILNRDKNYMIYIKEAEKISDFIKIIDATKAVLYYEDIRVYRDEKNITNRLNNCEQANIEKVIANANKELEDIRLLEETETLSLLDDKVLLAVKYRKKYPEASLKDLAELISKDTNNKITKSGLNHRLRKMKDLAKRIRKNLKENKNT